jgi:hypothetical protein
MLVFVFVGWNGMQQSLPASHIQRERENEVSEVLNQEIGVMSESVESTQ